MRFAQIKRFGKLRATRFRPVTLAEICIAGPLNIPPNNDQSSHRRNKRTAIAPRAHVQSVGLRIVSIGQCSRKRIDAIRLS
jgi:hypothetical protein